MDQALAAARRALKISPQNPIYHWTCALVMLRAGQFREGWNEYEWRWLMGRDDSPWYPSMRLFRQTTKGEWGGVVKEVRDALGKAAKA